MGAWSKIGPGKITLLYVAVSAVWILVSDWGVSLFVASPGQFALVSTCKGWGFVAVSGAMLCGLMRRMLSAIAAKQVLAEKALAAAEKANEAKTRFFAAASHDLRQPFQAMRLYFEVLNVQIADPGLRRALEGLERSMGSSETLLTDLLDVARIDSGLPPTLQRTAPGAIIHDVAEEWRSVAMEKGLSIRTVLHEDIVVATNAVMLKRILANLIGNAVRYTEAGGVLVGMRRRRGHVVVEVWDTGIGIERAVQDLVFEDFYQVDSLARERSQGVGLGLSIVTRLCHRLGYHLSLVSRPGRGSVFRVSMPLGGISPSGA